MTNSDILWQAYNKFFLNLGSKKVPTPYRMNVPYQSDPRKYGKSSAEKLTQSVIEIAREQNFNLEIASLKEIRNFMEENMLGIDCSGYVYHSLDYLLKKLGQDNLEKAGFPMASKTNVKRLSSDEFSIPIKSIFDIQPGDFITFRKGPHGHAHVLLIMEVDDEKITYTQSSGLGKVEGIQQNTIKIVNPKGTLKNQLWDEILANGQGRVDYFNPELGDGVRRLKVLQNHEQA